MLFNPFGNQRPTSGTAMSRRDLIKLAAAGGVALPTSGWFDRLAAHAAEQSATEKRKHKSCILLFMTGGPSHIDTFDPKPANKTSVFKPISTSVPGVQICDNLPKTAKMMKDMAILHGMSTTEGSHGRARYYMHTGYREGVGGVVHPSLGAIASYFLGKPDDDLPNYFCTGGQAFGAGYAGPFHAPVEVADPSRGIANLKPSDSMSALDKRTSLLLELENGFVDRVQNNGAAAHKATYERAAKLMHSEKAKAFDLSQESESVRGAYGNSKFGQGCLLARRLVESGVAFVEVGLGGWDTHRDNEKKIKSLTEELDPALSALIGDLKERSMLNDTLVIWMGDFGRTPHVGKQGGRDHYPRAWTSVLAGGGIKTGQAVGKTDKEGAEVVDGKVSAVDFMATVCQALGINYDKHIYANGNRPMRVVDKNEKVVKGLF
jgi:uncharacterized protein (DUF1501 family)